MTFADDNTTKLDKYIISVTSNGNDLKKFINNISLLDEMYDDISIVVLSDGKTVYPQIPQSSESIAEQEKAEPNKKGLFKRLFKF